MSTQANILLEHLKVFFLSFGLLYAIGASALVSSSSIREGFVFEKAKTSSCHASTLVELDDGELLCAWFGGKAEGDSDVGIWLSSYHQDSWLEPIQVAKHDKIPCWNPVLFQLPSKEVLLFYKVGSNPRSWTGFLKRSFNGGRTWSSPEKLPAGILGPIRNKPILDKAGEMICGSSVESWNANACWVGISKDAGRTWQKHGPIYLPREEEGIIQPTFFFDKEGALHALFRARPSPKNICQATSKDGGKTWSLAEKTSFSYPSVIETKDKKVHISYTWNRIKIKHVVLEVEG